MCEIIYAWNKLHMKEERNKKLTKPANCNIKKVKSVDIEHEVLKSNVQNVMTINATFYYLIIFRYKQKIE